MQVLDFFIILVLRDHEEDTPEKVRKGPSYRALAISPRQEESESREVK